MIAFIKFIHLLIALLLLGLTSYCLLLTGSKNFLSHTVTIKRINKIILLLVIIAMLTGTLLVPEHFTYHTPWIQAAYLLLLFFSIGIFLLLIFLKNNFLSRWLGFFIYLALWIMLVAIIHDAVTKSTFLI